MFTPAAKRRRVALANETLKKPFRSPLVSKNLDSKPRLDDAVPKHKLHEPSDIQPWTHIPVPSVAAPDMIMDDVTPFLATILRHQRAVDDDIKQLDKELKKAAHPEARDSPLDVATRKSPGERPGSGLEGLIVKWQAAARQAADELFPTAKERYQSMGGSKGLREMQQRQAAFFADMDGLPHRGKQDAIEGEEDDGDDEEVEEDEEEFTLGMMLRSMNIEFDLIGYDPEQDGWAE